MFDFDKLNKQLSKCLTISDIEKTYAIPNVEEIHNMICGYSFNRELQDIMLFDEAESIDYLNYERILWSIRNSKK